MASTPPPCCGAGCWAGACCACGCCCGAISPVLVLTCTGDLSRNRSLGIALAKGESLKDILGRTKMVAEGVRTTEAALALSAQHGIELPIASEMSDVLAGRTDPQTAIRNLMGRKQKLEHA